MAPKPYQRLSQTVTHVCLRFSAASQKSRERTRFSLNAALVSVSIAAHRTDLLQLRRSRRSCQRSCSVQWTKWRFCGSSGFRLPKIPSRRRQFRPETDVVQVEARSKLSRTSKSGDHHLLRCHASSTVTHDRSIFQIRWFSFLQAKLTSASNMKFNFLCWGPLCLK